MIDIIVEVDPDLSGIDKQNSRGILRSTLKQEQIEQAKINLIFAKDNLLNHLKIKYFQKKTSFINLNPLVHPLQIIP